MSMLRATDIDTVKYHFTRLDLKEDERLYRKSRLAACAIVRQSLYNFSLEPDYYAALHRAEEFAENDSHENVPGLSINWWNEHIHKLWRNRANYSEILTLDDAIRAEIRDCVNPSGSTVSLVTCLCDPCSCDEDLIMKIVEDVFYSLDDDQPTFDPEWLQWDGGIVKQLAEEAYQKRKESPCAFCIEGMKATYAPVGYKGDPSIIWRGSYSCPYCLCTGLITDGRLEQDRLSILADALEDAGCSDPRILDHLRGEVCPYCKDATFGVDDLGRLWNNPKISMYHNAQCVCKGTRRIPFTPHVRGCWVIDNLRGL